jgi:prepilin-type N-terminal cleavage/methylation domain-containing protein
MKRRGFTLIELLVVVAIIALLIAILLPSLGKAKELSNRSVCAANVRGIGQSMSVYAADNLEAYPIVAPTGATGQQASIYTAAGFSGGGANTNLDSAVGSMYAAPGTSGTIKANVMQNMWLLVMLGQVAPKQFVCKSDLASTQVGTLMIGNVYQVNFNMGGNNGDRCNSYGFDYPWTGTGTQPIGGWWRNSTDAGLPIMADMGPVDGTGTGTQIAHIGNGTNKASNSFNHQGDGQNVGFGDAHAEFTRVAGCGQNMDNIYSGSITPGTAGPTGQNPGTGEQSSSAPSMVATGGQGGAWDVFMVPISNANNSYNRQ